MPVPMATARSTLRTLLWLLLVCFAVPAADAAGLDDARALYEGQRYAEAQALLEELADREPGNAAVHHYLGRLARKRQDLAAAVEHLKTARDLAPDDPAIIFDYGATSSLYAENQGTSLRAAMAARNGRAALERAVELAPDNLDYRQALLEFYAYAPGIVGGSVRKAYEQADAIAARDERRGTYARGNLLVQEKRYPEALAVWRELRDAHPDDYWVLFQLGRTLAQSGGDPAEGIAALQQCLELPRPEGAPGPSRVNWNLGKLHRDRGDIEEARAAFRAALLIEPLNTEIATDLARLPNPAPAEKPAEK